MHRAHCDVRAASRAAVWPRSAARVFSLENTRLEETTREGGLEVCCHGLRRHAACRSDVDASLSRGRAGPGNRLFEEEPPAPSPAPSTAPSSSLLRQEARDVFNTLCSTCHGQGGKGDGAVAANLETKPRDYTDKVWQASISDEPNRERDRAGWGGDGEEPADAAVATARR